MLAKFQAQFSRNLLSSDVEPEFLLRIADLDSGAATQRLSVYRNNVMYSLTTALGDLYPVVKRLVGDDAFAVLAASFVRQHPPVNPVITFYGESFPAYIDEFLRQRDVSNIAYLADVARFEWLMHSAYYAADDGLFDPQSVQNLPAGRMNQVRLAPTSAVRLLQSIWPIVAIWEEQTKTAPGSLCVSAETTDRSGLVVYRHEYCVQYMELAPTCFSLLEHLLAGQTLGDAMVTHPEEADQLPEMFAFLMGLPLFSGFRPEQTNRTEETRK